MVQKRFHEKESTFWAILSTNKVNSTFLNSGELTPQKSWWGMRSPEFT